MKIHEIKLHQEFDAPVAQIWEAFNDHATFGKIMGQTFERIIDSKDAGNVNGLGSVRLIKAPLMPFQETIVKSDKPNCIDYQITKGTPLNYHYGSMQFKSLPGNKSVLDYSIKIGSKIPLLGGIVAAALQKGMGDGLKKYAKRIKK